MRSYLVLKGFPNSALINKAPLIDSPNAVYACLLSLC
jgi:hypothetical protein